MTERPILFSAPMVRAILAGTKTQTRRVVRVQPNPAIVAGAALVDRLWAWLSGHDGSIAGKILGNGRCPYGQPGDRLWVRETWLTVDGENAFYRADYAHSPKGDREHGVAWRPSIHMPRWASRITLEVTGVRVGRLQDISEADAMAEGACDWAGEQDTPVRDLTEARLQFRQLWESINGPGAWDANPWVWVVEFKRIDAARQRDSA